MAGHIFMANRIGVPACGALTWRLCDRTAAVCEGKVSAELAGARPSPQGKGWSVGGVALTSGHKVRLRWGRVAVSAPAYGSAPSKAGPGGLLAVMVSGVAPPEPLRSLSGKRRFFASASGED